MNVSADQWKSITTEVIGRLEQWYLPRANRLGTQGDKLVRSSLAKGGLRGGVKVRLLFEPAVLLAQNEDPDGLVELAEISKLIPFTGNYGLWEPARANFAICARAALGSGDARGNEFLQFVCWPENGQQPGPVQLTPAAVNRVNGLVVEQLRSDFTPPLKRDEFSHTIARIRELNVMWALGGSDRWPRPRIEDEIAASLGLIRLSGIQF